MRLLLINPNITPRVTEIMANEARRQASAGTVILAESARFGTQYIGNRVDAAIASHAVLEVAAERAQDVEAVIVSAFGDPGVLALREMIDVPVIGVSEASFHFALMLGERYAMVCLTERLKDWYVECAEQRGLAARLVSARAIASPPSNMEAAAEQVGEAVRRECMRAVVEDGAEVIIVAGGPMAGVARSLTPHVPVPLLDGVACGVAMAESVVRLGVVPPRSGTFARPPGKSSANLADALARWIDHSESA